MTKKHFELIARTLASVRDTLPSQDKAAGEEAIDHAAYELSLAFNGVSGRFDQNRFLRACHVNLENVL